MALFVGVDGGGTKTRVCLVDTTADKGMTVAGDASNPTSVGWDATRDRVIALIEQGRAALAGESAEVGAICAAVAGIDRPEQARRLTAMLAARFPSARITVVNDALAALAAGTRGGSGVVLIAGTGTIAVGEDRHGRVARAGGLGYLFGDEGSGFDIGRQGLLAAARANERRGPATALWRAACEVFGVASPPELVPAIHNHPHPVGTVASFARTVAALADSDDVAAAIMAGAVEQHSLLIGSVFEQLGPDVDSTVVLGGGFYAQPSRWMERLHTLQPGRIWAPLTYSAAAGAALRAMTLDAPHRDAPRAAVVAQWERIVRQVESVS